MNVRFTRVKAALALVALMLVSACEDPSSPYVTNADLNSSEIEGITIAMSSAEAGRAYLSGSTALSMNGDYGTQIEYLGPNGTSELWFPGQTRTTPGHWQVTDQGTGKPMMCFLYGPESYNPVERTKGGSWECAPLAVYLGHLSQIAKGDPFGLSDGAAPFAMPSLPYFIAMGHAKTEAGNKVSQRPLVYLFNRLKRWPANLQ